MAKSTKRQGTRKGPKQWRKHVDAGAVVQAMDDLRKDELHGGDLSRVESDKLFVVDTKPDTSGVKKKEKKPQFYDSFLAPNPFIKPVNGARKVATGPKIAQEPKLIKSIKKAKVTPPANPQKRTPLKTEETFDIWNETDEKKMKLEPVLPKDYEEKTLRLLNVKKSRKAPARACKVPVVEVPQPGLSYNPTAEHHADAVGQAVAAEMEIQRRKAEYLDRITYNPERDLPEVKVYNEDTSEESGGEEEEGGERPSKKPKISADKKKTVATRKRKQVHDEAERKRLELKAKKQAENEINQWPRLVKELNAEERAREENRIRSEGIHEENALHAPVRLGKTKYQEMTSEVLLTDELSGNLRSLKTSNKLLKDRFKSLQKRGIIEPRLPQKRKIKYERKGYERKTNTEREKEQYKRINDMPM